MGMQTLKVQWVCMVDDKTFGVLSMPVTDGELRMVALIGNTSHKDGIFLSPELMGEHLREVVGNLHRFVLVIDKTIRRLRPFQDDIGAFFPMKCEETTVEGFAFFFKNTHLNLNAGILEFLDATTLHLGEFIDATYDYPSHTFPDDQVGTWGRLAIV